MPKIDTNRKVGDQTKDARERQETVHERPLFSQADARDLAFKASAEGDGRHSYGEVLKRASLQTALAGNNNDLIYTARVPGTDGNDITVRYVDPAGNNAALSVDVTDTDIVVNLATDGASAPTSTAAQVSAAVAADADAAELVHVQNAPGNSGAGVVTALAETSLAGGTD